MDKICRYMKKERKNGFIQSFPFYTYDIIFDNQFCTDNPKLALVCQYLKTMFQDGMPARSKSASQMPQLKIEVVENVKENEGLKFVKMAKLANYRGQGYQQHPIVEKYFMDNHPDCLAVEFPMYNEEMTAFGDILIATEKPFEIIIIDFKPGAKKDKKAPTQVYYQRKLFAEMTGIATQNIRSMYFDDENCYELI